jgi:hypothetical protein
MFRPTPSQFDLMLSWDKKMPASSDFSLRFRNKSGEGDFWQIEQLADCLYAFAAF